MENQEIINKVAQSGILTFNLEDYYPSKEIVSFDIKAGLFMGLMLKEKEFRDFINQFNWSHYANKIVCIFCSEDAIVPTWAYMLVASALEAVDSEAIFGTKEDFLNMHYFHQLNQIDFSGFSDKNVVLKGCGEKDIPESAYVIATQKLQNYVKKLFFGEPCSTVPVYRKK